VTDALTAAIAAEDADRAEPLQREAEAAFSPYPEKDLLKRAITAAARAGSKAAGESPCESLLTTGDAAFMELERFRPLVEDRRARAILGRLAEALQLATDELGPFPGGRPGSFKAPGGAPQIVEEHEPTPEMMAELARRSGVVVGLAGAAGVVDSVAELRGVIDGCPVCGSFVAANGAEHQEIAPEEGPLIECGKCELGHHLEREKNASGPWRTGPRRPALGDLAITGRRRIFP
jgi:hypothetical protein